MADWLVTVTTDFLKMKIIRSIFISIIYLIVALVVVEIVFFATGRGGQVPCGEDSFRWGLMGLIIGFPMFIASLVANSIVMYKSQLEFLIKLIVSVLIQIVVSFTILAIIEWPQVIYVMPRCL